MGSRELLRLRLQCCFTSRGGTQCFTLLDLFLSTRDGDAVEGVVGRWVLLLGVQIGQVLVGSMLGTASKEG